jgi:hypothetical protein
VIRDFRSKGNLLSMVVSVLLVALSLSACTAAPVPSGLYHRGGRNLEIDGDAHAARWIDNGCDYLLEGSGRVEMDGDRSKRLRATRP